MPHRQAVQPIRCAGRALIVREGKLLTVILRDKESELHVLPGGGQVHGETLVQTVKRECREELGVDIAVDKLAYVREYIGANHGFARRHRGFHQVEAVFYCRIPDDARLGAGSGQDNRQIGLAWIPLADFEQYRFSPSILKKFVCGDDIIVPDAYLGDNH